MSITRISWQAPWRQVEGDEAAGLQTQLEREIGLRHPLAGKKAIVVGRRDDNDDVLAQLNDNTLVNVHLAWTRSALGLSRDYPSWFAYGGTDEFLRAMHQDAAEHPSQPSAERATTRTERGEHDE